MMGDGDVECGSTKKLVPNPPRQYFGIRHLQFFLLFFAITISYGMRTTLSVAIIPMTEKNPPNPGIPTYPEWKDTDTLLSSFFWGNILPQICAGQLSERFGSKWFLAVTVAVGAIFNILVPLMASAMDQNGVILCRIVLGFSQGFLYPPTHNLITKWTPKPERMMVANLIYGGSSLGTIICLLTTGALAETKLGWPLAFYLYGIVAFIWVLIWSIFGSDSPTEHATISEEEKDYIEQNTIKTCCGQKRKIFGTPWMAIMSSLPFSALLLVQCGQYWGSFTLFTEIPSYMSNIMGFELKENSQLSCLPYLVQWILGFIIAPIADKIITKQILNVTQLRKLMQAISSFCPAIALTYLAFIDSSQKTLAIFLLVMAVGTTATAYCAYIVNHIDLAPNYAGTLLGITNTIGTACSILGPLSVGLMGDDKTDPILWRKVFCISAGIYVATGVYYMLFASGELQPWNDIDDGSKKGGDDDCDTNNNTQGDEEKKTDKLRY